MGGLIEQFLVLAMQFLSLPMVIFALVIFALVFIQRSFIEAIFKKVKDNKIWREAFVPCAPIINGILLALLLPGFPYPEALANIPGGGVLCGIVAGLFSGLIYRIFKKMFYDTFKKMIVDKFSKKDSEENTEEKS